MAFPLSLGLYEFTHKLQKEYKNVPFQELAVEPSKVRLNFVQEVWA